MSRVPTDLLDALSVHVLGVLGIAVVVLGASQVLVCPRATALRSNMAHPGPPFPLPPWTAASEPPVAPGSLLSIASVPLLSSLGRNLRSQKRAKDRV